MSQRRESRPPETNQGAAKSSTAIKAFPTVPGATDLLGDLDGYVQHFRARVLQEAITEATAAYWSRRAEVLEAARHRPGNDYAGRASLDDLRARWVQLTEAAQACRHRAAVSLLHDEIESVVIDVLQEAS